VVVQGPAGPFLMVRQVRVSGSVRPVGLSGTCGAIAGSGWKAIMAGPVVITLVIIVIGACLGAFLRISFAIRREDRRSPFLFNESNPSTKVAPDARAHQPIPPGAAAGQGEIRSRFQRNTIGSRCCPQRVRPQKRRRLARALIPEARVVVLVPVLQRRARVGLSHVTSSSCLLFPHGPPIIS
jgi:hypothetical protein